MNAILHIKWSFLAFIVALVLGFLSMGALGAALYYTCYPLFAPFYGDLNDWRGDWVWPATIGAGMLWSISFVAAGWLNFYLEPKVPKPIRRLVYVFVLWLSAALVWAILLINSF